MKNFIEISDSEEEQVDKIKKWWDANGKQIIAGAVLGLAGIFGWNSYVDYQDSQALNARTLYLSYASDSANVGAYDKLIKDHPSSTYADQGTLLMAKYLFDAENYSLALDAIKPLTTRENSVIASTAILRTASLYLELGQHEKALSVLNIENVEGFSGLFYNLAGDVYLDLGNIEEAKNNYALAIENITENSSLTQLIQIKLDDLS
ncbi:MAG: tetratricopeptide repeat protein [Thiotrichales bacterium]|jgi:predicted negative regulator of RcsB-dependent stress response|nr:tetratricopeptide repeat protein [Thiotrichales bacterium]MBT5499960.1 tetratricopeptide repeat protein [Thiotrichales bacterium]MBT7149296.1 tetratricopeptide repeat protein [Thiotrichales bacterium]MBT7439475.1 tetratricopeptide repeat protein [Thiotrichales bacterium]MBT7933119.1 tetratricopeptide repeat protein [Thiotrichales bacterium]